MRKNTKLTVYIRICNMQIHFAFSFYFRINVTLRIGMVEIKNVNLSLQN